MFRRSREKTWKPERKTTKALVSRLSFYRSMLKTFLGDAMDHWESFNILFLLLFSEIMPCEVSSHLIKVLFVTKLMFFFLLEGFHNLQFVYYDKVYVSVSI